MIKAAVGALALATVLTGYASAEPITRDARFENVREYVISQVKDGKVVSMSIAVAEDGRIIWEESFGWADRENKLSSTLPIYEEV
jgi:hypothetical protein